MRAHHWPSDMGRNWHGDLPQTVHMIMMMKMSNWAVSIIGGTIATVLGGIIVLHVTAGLQNPSVRVRAR